MDFIHRLESLVCSVLEKDTDLLNSSDGFRKALFSNTKLKAELAEFLYLNTIFYLNAFMLLSYIKK